MTFSFKDHLEAARKDVDRSRSASERAKDLYVSRREHDLAVEELRLGIEHLVEALGLLETRVTTLEQQPTIFRRKG